MKKILLSFAFFVHLTYANIINSIAVVVDKEPITSYDIKRSMQALNISKQEALVLLINEKIELSQMKKLQIEISELEIDNAINTLLDQEQLSLEALKKDLHSKGQSYEQLRIKLKKDLGKRKLYDTIISTAKLDYSDDGVRNFFEQNRENFTIYTQIDVDLYRCKDAQKLEELRATHATRLEPIRITLTPHNSDPRLLALLSSVALGNFSPILNSQNSYELYQVRNKSRGQTPQYSQIKNEVLNAYVSQQGQNYLQDYFDKIRSRASIEYLN